MSCLVNSRIRRLRFPFRTVLRRFSGLPSFCLNNVAAGDPLYLYGFIHFSADNSRMMTIAAMICFISYHIIGSEVLPDGRLVEPFALLPIGYMLALMFMVSAICNFIFLRKRKNNAK